MCSRFEWSTLPSPGGIYDQHPQFIDGIEVIFKAESEKQEKDKKKQEREAQRAKKKGRK